MKVLRPMVLALGAVPATAFAQEAEPGGVFYTFDFLQSFEASTDFDLATEEEEEGFEGVTTMNFEVVTETRTQRLSFDVGTDVRVADGEVLLDGTTATLAYERRSADATLGFSIAGTRTDIAFLRDITDFIDAGGVLVLPDDLDELEGTGISNTVGFEGALEWGQTAPLGFNIAVSHEVLRYEDASSALLDSDTTTFDFGTRLNLNEVTTANLTLGFSRDEDEGADLDDSASLTGAITRDRPRGALTARATVLRDSDDDTFWLAAIDRVFEVPNGAFEGSIGVAQDDAGDGNLIAELTYNNLLPAGEVELSLSSLVDAGGDGRDTTVQASYARDLNDVSGLVFAFDAGQVEAFADDTTIATGGVSALFALELTPLWEMNVGARYDVRDEDGARTDATTVFLTLGRVTSWRR